MAEKRKLAAILAADVVGYSRLAGADEDRTLARLRALRSDLIDPDHRRAPWSRRQAHRRRSPRRVPQRGRRGALRHRGAERHGRAQCRPAAERRIEFRIGIHLGDVVEESDGDLMGDGVNIAARLEGVCRARRDLPVGGRLPAGAGRGSTSWSAISASTQLKNIAEPMRVYSLQVGVAGAGGQPTPARPPKPASARLRLPDKPSIAVLPFTNMSGDPEQEYFADGIVEDIITALSRIQPALRDRPQLELRLQGPRGRRAPGRPRARRALRARRQRAQVGRTGVRITGQLIDAATGSHLWADRFDGDLADIFDLQDEVTASVVGAIEPTLAQAEIERARRKPTESLDAYDHYLRGMAAFHQFERAANREALECFTRAFELDPAFAAALGMGARCYVQRKGFAWITDHASEAAEALRLARNAANAGRDDAIALAAAGFTLVLFGDMADGDAFLERALALNPNLAWAWHIGGFAKACCGQADAAVAQAAHAMRLSPQDPQYFAMQAVVALGHFLAGRNDAAQASAQAAARELPNFPVATAVAAASAALAGRDADAASAIARLRQIDPELRLSNLALWLPFQRPEHMALWTEGLRRAGLPE